MLTKERPSYSYDAAYEQMCGRKLPYQKKATAESEMKALTARGAQNLHLYVCPYCRQYHIGHRSRMYSSNI